MQTEKEKSQALQEIESSLTQKHVHKLSEITEKYQSEIDDLNSKMEKIIKEKSSYSIKHHYESEPYSSYQETLDTWMNSYLSTIKKLNSQIRLNDEEINVLSSAEKLLQQKEDLINCADEIKNNLDGSFKKLLSNGATISEDVLDNGSSNCPDSEKEIQKLKEKIIDLEETVKCHEANISRITEEHAQKINQVNQKHQKGTEELSKRLTKQSETLVLKDRKLEQEVENVTGELESRYEQEIDKIREYYEEQLSQVRSVQEWSESMNTSMQLQYTRTEVDELIEDSERRNKHMMDEIVRNHGNQIKKLDNEYEGKITQLQQNNILHMQNMQQNYNAEITRNQMEKQMLEFEEKTNENYQNNIKSMIIECENKQKLENSALAEKLNQIELLNKKIKDLEGKIFIHAVPKAGILAAEELC
ncbi:hypothetical protein GQR58_001678 [Nymphon striatum]|nr:hypothetical protein GQR58_001678 [Nymphon striatum]